MGLDMYLYRKHYVKNWNWMQAGELHEIVIKKGGQVRTDIDPAKICEIVEDVAYWRKANAIHRWFVENVQNGEDNCQEHYVARERLADLVAKCKEVLETVETVDGDVAEGEIWRADGTVEHVSRKGRVVAQKSVAMNALPTTGGFFFGKTDYDEDYLDDLRSTVEQLAPILEADAGSGGSYYYCSSW